MEFILISAIFGSSKPHPSIFQEALKRMALDPSEVVHVGDSWEDDISGARNAGIEAVWINRHGHSHPATAHEHAKKILTIQDLRELL